MFVRVVEFRRLRQARHIAWWGALVEKILVKHEFYRRNSWWVDNKKSGVSAVQQELRWANERNWLRKMSNSRQICRSLWWTNGVFLQRSWQLIMMAGNEIWVWSICGMILARKYWSTWQKTNPSALILHHKSYINWAVIEPGSPQWRACEPREP
jgi:hypothetical protein